MKVRSGFAAPGVWKPRGRGFSMGMGVAGDGVLVHLTGQVAWDAEERIVGAGDVAAQTEQAFRNIAALLDEIGGTMTDLVNLTTWFVRDGDLPAIQTVRSRWLDFDPAPASTSVRVAGLGHEDFLVELSPVAFVARERFRDPNRLRT